MDEGCDICEFSYFVNLDGSKATLLICPCFLIFVNDTGGVVSTAFGDPGLFSGL